MTPDAPQSLFARTAPDLLAFVIGLSVAYYLEWDTTDLVWSLWLCSLVLGYLTLLSSIGASAYVGLHVTGHGEFKRGSRTPVRVIGIGAGLFFLVFFSLHFCGFHAGHSVFLQQFFPLDKLPHDGFGEAFMNPLLLWSLVFQHLMEPYGLFLLPAIVAERQHVFQPLMQAVRAVHSSTSQNPRTSPQRGAAGKRRGGPGDVMSRPYINVVRMHLLIFFFALSHALKLDSFLIYAVVYAVYFFPWGEVISRPPPA